MKYTFIFALYCFSTCFIAFKLIQGSLVIRRQKVQLDRTLETIMLHYIGVKIGTGKDLMIKATSRENVNHLKA